MWASTSLRTGDVLRKIVVKAPSGSSRCGSFLLDCSLGFMHRSCRPALVILVLCLRTLAQHRSVAITIDDLPYVEPERGLTPADGSMARQVNRTLLGEFKRHDIPVTGFVNEQHVSALGSSGSAILRQWILRGYDLGNHTYSHPDINALSVPQIEDEILRGETTFVPLMRQAGKKPEFFRFPMNHTGDTKAKHDAISAFLVAHGYRLAASTIDNSDYLFNAAYLRILDENDHLAAKKLRREYLTYTSSEIDYYTSLNRQVLGYEPPHVMVLHDNRLNSDTIDAVLKLFEEKGYTFVSLGEAQSDAAYSIPDTYITEFGPMWGYRWAREQKVQVEGRLEPEPPKWVLDLARSK
jgi:peptidoglycan/xylan/chitin deacetylase (PgdA/CDA1 family)